MCVERERAGREGDGERECSCVLRKRRGRVRGERGQGSGLSWPE